jgi:hypothetical protein
VGRNGGDAKSPPRLWVQCDCYPDWSSSDGCKQTRGVRVKHKKNIRGPFSDPVGVLMEEVATLLGGVALRAWRSQIHGWRLYCKRAVFRAPSKLTAEPRSWRFYCANTNPRYEWTSRTAPRPAARGESCRAWRRRNSTLSHLPGRLGLGILEMPNPAESDGEARGQGTVAQNPSLQNRSNNFAASLLGATNTASLRAQTPTRQGFTGGFWPRP